MPLSNLTSKFKSENVCESAEREEKANVEFFMYIFLFSSSDQLHIPLALTFAFATTPTFHLPLHYIEHHRPVPESESENLTLR